MCEVLGYEVTKLKRVRIMNMTLTGLTSGQWRYFTSKEVEDLKALVVNSTGLYDENSTEPKAARGDSYPKKSSGRRRAGRPAQLPKKVLEKQARAKQEGDKRGGSSSRGAGEGKLKREFTKRAKSEPQREFAKSDKREASRDNSFSSGKDNATRFGRRK